MRPLDVSACLPVLPVGSVPSGWQVTVWVLLRESPDSAAGSVQTKDSVSPTAMEI